MSMILIFNVAQRWDTDFWFSLSKLRYGFKCIPICLYRKPFICNVSRPRVMWVGVARWAHKIDDLYPISSNLQYGYMFELYGPIMHVVTLLPYDPRFSLKRIRVVLHHSSVPISSLMWLFLIKTTTILLWSFNHDHTGFKELGRIPLIL